MVSMFGDHAFPLSVDFRKGLTLDGPCGAGGSIRLLCKEEDLNPSRRCIGNACDNTLHEKFNQDANHISLESLRGRDLSDGAFSWLQMSNG